MKLDEKAWEKWQMWIRRIKDDLGAIVTDVDNFVFFRDTINASVDWIDAHSGGWFIDFVVRGYIARTTLGLRRQLDPNDDVISLARLADQLAECAPQLTMEFYKARFPATNIPWHHSAFRHISDDGVTASWAKIEARIEHLRQVGAEIKRFANKTIAHANKNDVKIAFTFAELEKAIGEFEKLAIHFYALLTGDGYSSFVPTHTYPRKKVFQAPFIRPEALEPAGEEAPNEHGTEPPSKSIERDADRESIPGPQPLEEE